MTQFSNELNQKMTPVYVGKFNLTHHPFSNQFNSTLFYENEGRKIVLKKISHLLEFTKLILFIQGAEGLGKTTLIRQRIRQAKDNWRTCLINAKDYTTPQAFITKIAEDMGIKLSHSNQEYQIQSIQEQLDAMHQAGLTPILYIDDIEEINHSLISTLASLIRHTPETQPNLRLVIIGQDIPPALSVIIPLDNNESTLKYLPLPPLTEKESAAYTKHRLNVSGYEYLEPFNKNQLKKIYLDSKGFPTHINQLADHLFSQYALDYENKKPIINLNEKSNKILKFAAGGLGGLVVIFITYSLFDSDSTEPDVVAINTNNQELKTSTPAKKNESTAVPALQQDKPIVSRTLEIPAKSTKEESKETPKPAIKAKIEPTIEKEKLAKEKPKEKVTKEKIKPKTTSTKKDTAWIKAQNPKHYTLQLIGGSNRKAALKFIKKHKLEKDTTVVNSLRKGKNWYIVIYKSFKTTKSAKQASKKLPASLRRIKPWTRPFSAIQKNIK